MDLTFTDTELAFRDEVRDWLADNSPGEPPDADEDGQYAWRRDWQRRLHEDGWAGVHWPTEYGGRGATLMETAIFFEEMGRARAPLPANVLGLLLGGPTLDGLGHRRAEGALPRRRSSPPRRSGARASPSPTPARTSPR